MTTTTTPVEHVADVSMEAFVDTINGFDEIAIDKYFGIDPFDVDPETGNSTVAPLKLIRSMIFVHQRREGNTDRAAYEASMEVPVGKLEAYFTPEPADPNAGDSAGEGDGASGAEPATTPPGATTPDKRGTSTTRSRRSSGTRTSKS